MASSIEMRRQDMIELYQLLRVYLGTYPEKRDMTEMIMEDIENRFEKIYDGKIKAEQNPRNAGRKSSHTSEEDRRIRGYRSDGLSYREIARKCGCPLSRVQGAIKGQVYRN